MYENKNQAELYDRLYQDRKDYDAEAAQVAGFVRARKDGASSLLDVACGTGIHLAAFAKQFNRVAGLDLSEWMAQVASERLGGVPVHRGDMRSFDLGETFDSVVCMFSSIGYLRTVEDLESAVAAMTRHLSEGGVLAIEPWYFPDTFLPQHVSVHALKDGDRAISRVSHSTLVDGNVTRMEIHYLTADPETGVQHRSEIDDLTLFSREDYANAFRKSGLSDVEYVETGGGRPGFFLGTRA
ncbi:class I SAM-dependent DNA methyltransferase [Streptomyces lavendulae]|uniref:NDP-aminohexose N,N-dimethyltransferase n=2 Tax=Streptomycetaceae TaxID=2062 RepID=E1ARK0_KITAU|nr:class I SAM-dependent methyltransferase [Streptomyces lavendulae]ADM72819.1 NDP-aminohexose N,N-dimethyltransferase [Streptomyces lavendulae subsp. lavendulae]ATZ29851.1 dTDP-3-amino-3,4,6-trideoxy-alpha-D-glucopyranose [Streptomyces lavendulae subsp. lavendulae]